MTWEALDAQARRKTIIFAAIVGVIIVLLTWPASEPRKRPPAPPQIRQVAKPETRKLAPGTRADTGVPPHVSAPKPASALPFTEVLGQYFGHEMLAGRGGCRLELELRRSREKESEFAGFTNLVCMPTLTELRAENNRGGRGIAADVRSKAANPTVATLTGAAVDGSIRLHAVKNFGVRDARQGCELTSLSVTPLSGNGNTVAVEWRETQEGFCQGGQIVMSKKLR